MKTPPKRSWLERELRGWSEWSLLHFGIDAGVTWLLTLVIGWALQMPPEMQIQLAIAIAIVVVCGTGLFLRHREDKRRRENRFRLGGKRYVARQLVELIAAIPGIDDPRAIVHWGVLVSTVVKEHFGETAQREFEAIITRPFMLGGHRPTDQLLANVMSSARLYLQAKIAKLHAPDADASSLPQTNPPSATDDPPRQQPSPE